MDRISVVIDEKFLRLFYIELLAVIRLMLAVIHF